MCGVVAGEIDRTAVERILARMAYRGPDGQGIVQVGPWTLGHARLAIRGLGDGGAQPMTRGQVTVSFNGELYNDAMLRAELGGTFSTDCDTETVAVALDRWGVDALPRFDGMFALAWVADDMLFLARDRYGEVPLHVAPGPVAASEVAPLLAAGARQVRWVGPGTVETYSKGNPRPSVAIWAPLTATPVQTPMHVAAIALRAALDGGVADRLIADQPVGILVSGGLDSAAVALAAGAKRAYTAVYDRRSRDLRCARLLANQIGVDLIEVPVSAPTADDLAITVGIIEMSSKAQVEIAWACLHLARAAHADGIRVLLSGEGSDELWASYGSGFHGVAVRGWHRYRAETFLGQHRKNFARCNKVFLRYSVECRLPYLSPAVVDLALSLPVEAVSATGRPGRKDVLAAAYPDLPTAIIRRPKAAFQTEAGLDVAAAAAVSNPTRFYRSELARQFPGLDAGRPAELVRQVQVKEAACL